MAKDISFKIHDKVVYPSHGVGEIIDIEKQVIADVEVELYVISFPQDKMILRVPVKRALQSGLRPIVDKSVISKIYDILQGKPKQGNRMWSRRAQEYETKINSGDIMFIAEVVRDLYKSSDSDRSYSERTIYEAALNRLASEIAILESINQTDAVSKLLEVLREKTAA